MSAAAVIIIQQRRAIRRYEEAGARSPETARRPDELGCRESWAFRRLVTRGVLRELPDGRLHLDADGVRRYEERLRFARGVVVLLLVAGLALALLL